MPTIPGRLAVSPCADKPDDDAAPTLLEQVLALDTQPIVWLVPETIVVSGSAVTDWAGYQDTSISLAQGTGANQPAYISSEPTLGGQPCVHMDTAVKTLVSDTVLTGGTGGTWIDVVVRTDPGHASNNISRTHWGSDAGSVNCHVPFVDGNVYDNFGTSARKSFASGASLNGTHIYRVQSTNGLWSAHVDGAQKHTTGTNTFGWSATAPRIGATAQSSADKWGALLVFNALVSAEDLVLWEAYLSEMFSL